VEEETLMFFILSKTIVVLLLPSNSLIALVLFGAVCGRRLGIIADERDIPDFQSFRSRKKSHVGRIMVKRIDEYSLFENNILQSGFLSFQRAGKADGARTNDQNI